MSSILQAFIECIRKFGDSLTYMGLLLSVRYVRVVRRLTDWYLTYFY
jgi:hypothetical protein